MSGWLDEAAARIAAAAGDDASGYALTEADVVALLDLARVAAHDSGERINAPLVCYQLGLALGRHPELGLAGLAAQAGGGEAGPAT